MSNTHVTTDGAHHDDIEIDPMLRALLKATADAGASDLHLTAGRVPTARRDGQLVSFEGVNVLTPTDTERFVASLLGPVHSAKFDAEHHVDFSFGLPEVGRFRVNAFQQRGSCALAMRLVPARIRSLAELGCPDTAHVLMNRPFGLVLVVGPTGSGKSTTLAAMIDHINRTRACHILTLEDPIEFLHSHNRAIVNQREVGSDVRTFEEGLRSALREDPDVILLGEMRDVESVSHALTMAETGHLVFATLHTNDAAQSLDRIVDVFPANRRHQVQVQLSAVLQGVVSQRLLPATGGGRVAAFEVLLCSDAVRSLVREGKTHQLRNVMIGGQSEGMQTLEMDLARLVASGLVATEHAEAASAYPREVLKLVATNRSMQSAQATVAAGQTATAGHGRPVGT